MDVLSATEGDDTIAWYENDGSENFTAHPITSSADYPRSVYATDVDSDGDMDVLSASVLDNTIAWHENDGGENFTTHIITNSADGAKSVHAADVDGDGDMDVLSASGGDDTIAWYENDGSENFAVHPITTSADGASSVYAADMDGDGDMDVLSTSERDKTVAWYENDGSESFTAHPITTTADYAASVYAADMDGDGDMDVLSVAVWDNTVAWYENKSSSRIGDGVVKYQVAVNESAAERTGTITVAGKTHTVIQEGAQIQVIPPTITSQSSAEVAIAGNSASFSVTASGSEPLISQWKFSGEAIAGATSSSLTLNNVKASDAGDYSVVVTNEAGSVESETATLTVHYTLSTAATGSGTVTVSPEAASYEPGTQVTLNAEPSEGYMLGLWSGDASGTTDPLTVTLDGNKIIRADFVEIPLAVNLIYVNGNLMEEGTIG